MNPWKELLESLHSAFMDELRDRLGADRTLELGMPTPFAGWGLADPALTEGRIAPVSLDGREGWAFLAAAPDAVHWARGDVAAYWQGVLVRARGEFIRRGIAPAFGAERPWSAAGGFPGAAPARLIWMPVRVQGRAIAVAVGR